MSAESLREVRKLVEKNDDLEEEFLQETAYKLLSQQFLIRDKGRDRKAYHLVVKQQSYFHKLMKATNHQLLIEEGRGFVGIIPVDYTRRMSLDETLFLLVMRYIYDEEVNSFNCNDDGSIDVSVKDFELRYQSLTNRELPQGKGDFLQLIDPFLRFGIIKSSNDDERNKVWVLHVYPTIATLINGEALKRVEVYLKAEDIDTTLKVTES